RLGIAEHDADLLAKLVDEDETAFRFRDCAGELPQRLRHEPRLQPHLRVAHFAFDFRLRHERRDRVDDDDVDAVRSNEYLDDLERLLAVVRLRDEEVIEIHAKLLRIRGVERVLRVDKRGEAAELLRFRNHLKGKGRLAGRLRSEDLDDAAARHAADAEREVDADRAGGNGVDRLNGAFLAKAHDRSLAELLFDLADGDVDSLEAFAVLTVVSFDGGHARAPVTRGEVTALFMARGAPPPLARAAALEDSLLARAAGA